MNRRLKFYMAFMITSHLISALETNVASTSKKIVADENISKSIVSDNEAFVGGERANTIETTTTKSIMSNDSSPILDEKSKEKPEASSYELKDAEVLEEDKKAQEEISTVLRNEPEGALEDEINEFRNKVRGTIVEEAESFQEQVASEIEETMLKVGAKGDDQAASADEIFIDLKTQTAVAEGGLKAQYGELKVVANQLQRDEENNMIRATNEVQLLLDNPTGRIRIDSDRINGTLDGEMAEFFDFISYMEVGKLTGAQKPNDRVYFGGESGDYRDSILNIRNAWFTTDPEGVRNGDVTDAGYYIAAENITVIPDDRIVFKNNELYIKNRKYFYFPWFAQNIRRGSKIPLFPSFGNSSEEGFYITQGIQYGNKSKLFKGGIAPKFSDKLGWMIGRFENWTDTKYGKGFLSIDDMLLIKKDSSIDDRYRVNYEHEYKNDYGKLDFKTNTSTVNLIGELEDYRDEKDRAGYYNPSSPLYVGKPRDDGDTLTSYNFNADFDKFGKEKDMSFKSSLNLIKEEDVYTELVTKRMEDAEFYEQLDHKEYSNFEFKKENDSVLFKTHYNYLYDYDPGSTSKANDLQSRRENYGIALNDKENKIDILYDKKKGDLLRKLKPWERAPELKNLIRAKGGSIQYVPWSVLKYDLIEEETSKLHLGEYVLNENMDYKLKFDSKSKEKKLNTDKDEFMRVSILDNSSNSSTLNYRDMQYNRFENLVYSDEEEGRIGAELLHGPLSYEIGMGTSKTDYHDREGIYNYDGLTEGQAYKRYLNESDFYDFQIKHETLDLGDLGEASLRHSFRYDKYTKGYDTILGYNGGGDSTFRNELEGKIKGTYIDNLADPNREVDTKLDLGLGYNTVLYSYDKGSRKDSNEDYMGRTRLKHKANKHEGDLNFNLEYGNTNTEYRGVLTYLGDAYDSGVKKGVSLDNKIIFGMDEEPLFDIGYRIDKRYTRGELFETGYDLHDEYNDLNLDNISFNYYMNDLKFSYNRDGYNYDLTYQNEVDRVKEDAYADTFGVTYKFNDYDTLTFNYTRAINNRLNYDSSIDRNEVAIDNNIFGLTYHDGGPEIEKTYRVSYGRYKYDNEGLKSFSREKYGIAFTYRDKRFEDDNLEKLAEDEYDKKSDQVTEEELERLKGIIEEREDRSLDFEMDPIFNENWVDPTYSRYIAFSASATRHLEAGQDYDFSSDFTDFDAKILAQYGRFGLGYEYSRDAYFNNKNGKWNRNITKDRHELSLQASIGKPSQGWVTKFYGAYEDNHGAAADDDTYEYGVEVGKEMGYYMWSVGAERKWHQTSREEDTRAVLQFKLLTFPEHPIVGAGVRADEVDAKPIVNVFDGIDVTDEGVGN